MKDKENILLADTPEEFADRVSLLFKDAALRERIARSARALVESSHSWSSVASRFDSVFRDLAMRGTQEYPSESLASASTL